MIYYKEEKKKLVIPSGFVMIPVECDEAIEQAREDGYREGFADGSSATCDTEEGTYSLTDDFDGEETVFPSEGKTGFNKIVIVDDGYGDKKYNEGYDDGIANCSGSTPCDCSSAITEAYQSGVTEGMAEQKALLSSTAITSNGTYTSENGWNSVTVDVPAPPIIRVEKRFNLESGDTSPWTVRPDWTTYMTDVIITDNGYGQAKFDQGYEAGLAQCSGGTSCNLQDDYELYLDGSETAGQMPIWPNEGYDGISQGTVFYMEAYQNQWNSGHTSGFTDGYQSGYTEGYTQGQADCPQCSGGTCNLETGIAPLGSSFDGDDTITPPQGYDGFSSVRIIDNGYGQSKYDEGYADGQASVHCPTNVQSTVQRAMEQQQETIYPDAGYDAMGSVYVDGSGLWNSAYTEGHTSGYTEGYNAAITANCGSAITEAYESGYTEGYNAADTKIYSSSKDVYFDELTWVDVESSTAYSEEDTIMIDYKWGNTVTGINPIVLFSNESYNPAAVNPPSPTTPSFSIVLHTAGPNITTDDGQGTRDLWLGLQRGAQANHSYRLIVQTYSYTSSVTIKAALIDLTSGQITTGSTNTAVHFTGATSLNYCINGWRNTVDGVYEGMNTDWYLGGIKIFDNRGVMKHNYHFLNGCISDVVNDLETGYEAKYYDNSVETTYSLTGVEETMRFFY